MNNNQQNKATVMLTVDAGNISVSTLDLAVAMAASVQTRLHGLFIESEDLLRTASLPFTREISVTTAREHPTDYDKMQRSLHNMAEQFRQSLERAAQASQIPWSFDCVRGVTEEVRFSPRPDISYLIIDESAGWRASPKAYQSLRRVLLIENQSPNMINALNVVIQNFQQEKVEVTAIAAADTGIEKNTELQQHIKNADQSVIMLELERGQLTKVLSQAGTMFDYAICSRHEDDQNRRRILDSLQCPVIMVS